VAKTCAFKSQHTLNACFFSKKALPARFGQLEFGGSTDGENPQKLGTQKQKNHRIFYAHMTLKGNEGNKKQL
jgi:hypothetical protein